MEDIDALVKLADKLIFEKTHKYLLENEWQEAVLKGSLQGKTYTKIGTSFGYSKGHARDTGAKLLRQLEEVLEKRVTKYNVKKVLKELWYVQEVKPSLSYLGSATNQVQPLQSEQNFCKQQEKSAYIVEDWGEAPDVSIFYGRTEELNTLKQWLVRDCCRLVGLFGMGGIGKSALSVKLAQETKEEFQCIIWRSLREAPPIEKILVDLIKIISNQQDTDLPVTVNEKITRLIGYLRSSRCLLVLDNAESLFQKGNRTGQYLEGYENYGTLLKRIGESHHESCLVITSREKPGEVSALEGEKLPIRTFPIVGLQSEAQEILKAKGLSGSPEEMKRLVNIYSGNPLALKLISTSIKDLFNGNISNFLSQGVACFNGIQELLDEQFKPLSDLEKTIMYWLAINREPVTVNGLYEDIFPTPLNNIFLGILGCLKKRSLIELTAGGFTLQNVVMEYVTNQLIENIEIELESEIFNLINTHAIVKVTTKEYIREAQIRQVLKPIANKILNIEEKINKLLLVLREDVKQKEGYLAGNLINILVFNKIGLANYNFSNLTIRQAYLQDIELHDVDFSHSHIIKSVFAQTLGTVLSVAFSLDGNLLAAGDASREVRVWQVANGEQILLFQGQTGWVWSVAFSPDSNILASGGNNQLRLWNLQTGQLHKVLQKEKAGIWSVAFSPDGETLASGHDDTTIKLWNIKSGQCIRTLPGHSKVVRAVAFSPDGETLASGSDDKTVRLWNLQTGQCEKILEEHTKEVRTVAFSKNGQLVASGSSDRTVRIWDIKKSQCLKSLLGHTSKVRAVAFSHTNQKIASSSYDKSVKIWDVQTGQCLKTCEEIGSGIESIAFNSDGQTIAVGSYEQSVRLLDIKTGLCSQTWQGYTYWIWSVAFCPVNNVLASSGDDKAIRLWNVKTGETIKVLRDQAGRIWSIAFASDGKTIASGSEDHKVKVWDVETGECLRVLPGHTSRVRAVAFKPNSKILASASEDQKIRIWDVEAGECLEILEEHTDFVWSISFSPDGKTLASGSVDRTIKLWNPDNGKCFRSLEEHDNWVLTVAFSPDGNQLASSSADKTVKIWDIKTGRCLKTLNGHKGWVWSVAFSPDGKTLASGSYDKTIKLWDITTNQCLYTLEGHKSWVRPVAFSHDGRVLASGSEDETIKLWSWSPTQCQCFNTLLPEKQYDGMNISGIRGLTKAQKETLKALGAVEN